MKSSIIIALFILLVAVVLGSLMDVIEGQTNGFDTLPDSIYWAVRADGTLLGLTYQREEDVIGWHRHIIGGKAVNCTITLTDYANIQTGTKLKFTKSDLVLVYLDTIGNANDV